MPASSKTGAELLRSEVLSFTAYSPGLSIEEIKERYNLTQVVKLASNENPLGASPVVQQRIRNQAGMVFRYPQSGNPRLVEALANHLGVGAERVVVGNGSDELIDLILRVRVRPEEEVLAFSPCFSMYKLQARLCGLKFRQVSLNNDYSFPWDALLEQVNDNTAVVFVTSPDNPSGYTATADEIADLARALPRHCLLVVDEAYIDFAVPQEKHTLLPRLQEPGLENVVLLRTFSKMFGLAGLRLGYGVFPDWLADYLWRVRMPFSVNILAEEAGLAALEDRNFYQATLDVVLEGRDMLTRELSRLGCEVYPSQANFLLFAPPSGKNALELFDALLRRGVIIRPLKSYDMPDKLRVSIGNKSENELLIKEMESILQEGGA